MWAAILVTCCLILCTSIGQVKAYSSYASFKKGGISGSIIYNVHNAYEVIPFSEKHVSDHQKDSIQSCVNKHFDEIGDVQGNDIHTQIESYLKNYMKCALKTNFDTYSSEDLCLREKEEECKRINSFDDAFKSDPQAGKFRFGVVLRDLEVKNDQRYGVVSQLNDEDQSGCNNNMNKDNPSTGKFNRAITQTQTVDMQLDKSNKVSFANGLDVDVSWSVGFLGIWSAGQSYSGRYMVTDSDSTATSEKTTQSIMRKTELEMSWKEPPRKAVQTEIYRRNQMGKRKFVAWMEVQGWLGQLATRKRILGPNIREHGYTVLTLLPIGDFAQYHERLGVERLNAHSFMFPIVGYMTNNVTEYVFKLNENSKCEH